jgi:hypothetical protein
MRSPLISTGDIEVQSLPTGGLPALITSVEQALARAKASRLEVHGDTISFHGTFLLVASNWNILVPISSGHIHFARSGGSAVMHYEISFVGLFVSVTLLCLIPLFLVADPVRSGLIFVVPFAWLWLFGANYVITRVRFPRFLASAAGASLPPYPPLGSPFPDY